MGYFNVSRCIFCGREGGTKGIKNEDQCGKCFVGEDIKKYESAARYTCCGRGVQM